MSSYEYGSSAQTPPGFNSVGSASYGAGSLGSYESEEEDSDVVTFYVHKETEEKLWECPPEAELHLYERWAFDSISGEITQQEGSSSAEGSSPTPRSPTPRFSVWQSRTVGRVWCRWRPLPLGTLRGTL